MHPYFADGINDLTPFLPEVWRRRIGVESSWAQHVNAASLSLPGNTMYINASGSLRRDTVHDGKVPASDPEIVRRQLLDEYQIDRAILVGAPLLGLGAIPDPDLAAALASAYNDWLSERWLQAEKRYRGGLIVAPQDPQQAAAEIERVGDRPGMVMVVIPLTDILMGDRHYYPIYDAAQSRGLPVAVHPASTEGIFVKGPRMAGTPTYYVEWHTGLTQVHQSNLMSLVCNGVFERFTDLKYIIIEGGFAWAIDIMLRLDSDWKALRTEVPWVKRRPSEYVRDHIRFTTQPFVEVKRHDHLIALLDMLEADRTLLFSSDYPHWDFDNPTRALARVPDEMRTRIFSTNAQEVFGEKLE